MNTQRKGNGAPAVRICNLHQCDGVGAESRGIGALPFLAPDLLARRRETLHLDRRGRCESIDLEHALYFPLERSVPQDYLGEVEYIGRLDRNIDSRKQGFIEPRTVQEVEIEDEACLEHELHDIVRDEGPNKLRNAGLSARWFVSWPVPDIR